MGLHSCRDRDKSGVLQTGCAHKHGGGGGYKMDHHGSL